eukprot:6202255-Pleurochrysis_carterae.AAC.2
MDSAGEDKSEANPLNAQYQWADMLVQIAKKQYILKLVKIFNPTNQLFSDRLARCLSMVSLGRNLESQAPERVRLSPRVPDY